jgi:lactate 2-monooxygenase
MATNSHAEDKLANRTSEAADTKAVNITGYAMQIYQQGLNFKRSQFTFDTSRWQAEGEKYLSAYSIGYVSGNAGSGETGRKNLEAFQKWSIVSSSPKPCSVRVASNNE